MLAWNDCYSVGLKAIDRQHQVLIDLARRIATSKDPDNLARAFSALFTYTRIHFEYEEETLRELGSPLLDEHRRLHEDLLQRLTQVAQQRRNPTFQTLAVDLLKHWVFAHIREHDRAAFAAVPNAELPGGGLDPAIRTAVEGHT